MVQDADRQEAPRRRIAVKLGDDGQRHPAPKTMVNRLPIEVGDLPEVWVVCFSSCKGRGVMLVQGIDAVDAPTLCASLKTMTGDGAEDHGKDLRVFQVEDFCGGSA